MGTLWGILRGMFHWNGEGPPVSSTPSSVTTVTKVIQHFVSETCVSCFNPTPSLLTIKASATTGGVGFPISTSLSAAHNTAVTSSSASAVTGFPLLMAKSFEHLYTTLLILAFIFSFTIFCLQPENRAAMDPFVRSLFAAYLDVNKMFWNTVGYCIGRPVYHVLMALLELPHRVFWCLRSIADYTQVHLYHLHDQLPCYTAHIKAKFQQVVLFIFVVLMDAFIDANSWLWKPFSWSCKMVQTAFESWRLLRRKDQRAAEERSLHYMAEAKAARVLQERADSIAEQAQKLLIEIVGQNTWFRTERYQYMLWYDRVTEECTYVKERFNALTEFVYRNTTVATYNTPEVQRLVKKLNIQYGSTTSIQNLHQSNLNRIPQYLVRKPKAGEDGKLTPILYMDLRKGTVAKVQTKHKDKVTGKALKVLSIDPTARKNSPLFNDPVPQGVDRLIPGILPRYNVAEAIAIHDNADVDSPRRVTPIRPPQVDFSKHWQNVNDSHLLG